MALNSDNLKDLLVDMGRFLGETLMDEALSTNAEMQRADLLQRLEPHIRQPGTEVSSAPNTPPPYLDMNGPKVAREEYVDAEVNGERIEEEYEEFPEPVSLPMPPKLPTDSQTSSTSSSGQSEDYVNLSLPYSELRTMTNKCGPLWRKEKFIFLDQWRRCWAGLYGHVVLVYNSERDAKPTNSFNIQGFEARPIASNNHKDPKKRDSLFEVVCPGKKTYQFIARTAKDMTQWVIAIGLASCEVTPTVPHRVIDRTSYIGRRKLPSLPDSDSETYDDVGVSLKSANEQQDYEPVHSDEEEIYHDIADIYQRGSEIRPKSGSEAKPINEEPPLPPRQTVPSISQEDMEDQDAVYDDVGVTNSSNVYYNVTNVSSGENQTEVQAQETEIQETENNEEEVEEEIYDDIGINEQPSETIKLPPFRRESSGNGGRIQHIIKKMEASMGNGNKSTVGYRSKPEPIKQMESEELYEPIENGEAQKSPPVPELPPRSNVR